MDDDEEYGDEGDFTVGPQRWSWVTLIRAGLDFAGHVAHGAACAISIVQNGVLSHEVRMIEEKNFADQLSWELESLPETEE